MSVDIPEGLNEGRANRDDLLAFGGSVGLYVNMNLIMKDMIVPPGVLCCSLDSCPEQETMRSTPPSSSSYRWSEATAITSCSITSTCAKASHILISSTLFFASLSRLSDGWILGLR